MVESGNQTGKPSVNPYNAIAGAGLLVMLAIGGWAAWHYNFGSPEVKFLAACDSVIKDRLKAPATYNRAGSPSIERRQAELLEYMGTVTPGLRAAKDELAKADPEAKKIIDAKRSAFRAGDFDFVYALIKYDAANGYGTPIRSISECAVVVRKGDDPLTSPRAVMVDGYTSFDWSLKLLREAG